MDPVDWAAWGYGKIGHWGLVVVLLVVIGVIALIWIRGVERYQAEHQDDNGHDESLAATQETPDIAEESSPQPTAGMSL